MSLRENNLDERQKLDMLKAGNRSFVIMMFTCVICMAANLLWEKFDMALGMNIVLIAGSFSYTAGCIKAGLWNTNHKLAGIKGVLFYSCTFSVLFTLLFWAILIMNKKPGDETVNQKAAAFFGICFALVFIVAFLGDFISERMKRRNERKYED